ncbi:GspE/PulE family protein [Undibacterium sp. Di24W]|uniref:GspE/PulE family protein n=1 Tax=Undibacterium sp. Di24W TaxID=3413033 RepID=UPI003BF34B57
MPTTHHASQPIAHNTTELTKYLNLQSNLVHEQLGQYLLREDLVSAEALRESLKIVHRGGGKKLGEVLVDMGALTASALNHALLSQLEVPSLKLDNFKLDSQALSMLPAEIAQRFQALPIMLHMDNLVLATASLLSQQAHEFLRFVCQKKIINVVADEKAIRLALSENYSIQEQEEGLEQFERTLETDDQDQQASQDAEFMAKQQPIVKLVESILQTAVLRNASDIHIRPEPDYFDLLYRIDGSLQKIKEYPRSLLPAVVGRIKILARLNIAERRQPQDGRIGYLYENSKIDLRISIIPVQYGESIVIRVLNKNQGLRTINQIGFTAKDEARFNDLLDRSHGIVLVTGPTGSGKSTTLYAALQEVVKREVNVITVEDPVEYELHGTRQIQLVPAIHFSFPQALRHILRHDPDVIMIGEMRDVETCKIALESALTGHLVFSTLHTNDAASSIVRLMEMGVEAYMIRASVIGILAQRLVRKNCPHCLQEEKISSIMRGNLGLTEDEVFFQGRGCDHCHQTGFSGRLAIYELMVLNDRTRELIQAGMSADALSKVAAQEGMTKISENAVFQARLKKTSIAEVYRACM